MPQETETDLPVSVQEFPEEVGLTVTFSGIRGNRYNSPGNHGMLA